MGTPFSLYYYIIKVKGGDIMHLKRDLAENPLYLDIIKRRKAILSENKTKLIKRKQANLYDMHICAVCGRPLSEYSVRRERYVSTCRHLRFTNDTIIKGCLCLTPQECYRHLIDKLKKEV